MADPPWKGRVLTPGQIAQRLRSLNCTKLDERLPGAELWKAPTGQVFWISLDECDADYLEGIVEQIQKWADEKR